LRQHIQRAHRVTAVVYVEFARESEVNGGAILGRAMLQSAESLDG
jgi:hypothetical protein